MSTLDASCATKYIEVIIVSNAVYTGCCTARKSLTEKLLLHSVYYVLTQISNDFQRSHYRIQCRQTLAVAAQHVWCRHGVTHLSRRNKATLASDHRLSRYLSSLQRWKAVPIFTRVLRLALFFADFSSSVFLSAISIFLSLGSAVHWMLSPPYHE